MDIKRGNQKPITINDLALPFLKQDSSSALKRKLVSLSSSSNSSQPKKEKEQKGARKATSSRAPDIIPVPLPRVTQDRIQRKAAYTETSKNISQWLPVVMENRKADHLSFPLNDVPSMPKVTSATLVAKFEPTTALEQEIEKILKKGAESTASSLTSQGLPEHGTQSIEELKRKQIELQRMRSFMFFQEKKLKHSAKIKSKSYHRIKKKEKAKAKLAIEDETIQMRERVKREMERAKERMTLRHRSSQRQLHQGSNETDKQLAKDDWKRIEALKKKVALNSSDSEIQSDASDTEEMVEKDMTTTAHKKSALFGMKFMQRGKNEAEKASKSDQSNDEELDGSESDQSNDDGDENRDEKHPIHATDSDIHSSEDETNEGENSHLKNVGRKSFKKSKQESDAPSTGSQSAPTIANSPSSMTLLVESPVVPETEPSHSTPFLTGPSLHNELNPWSELNTSNFSTMPKTRTSKRTKEEKISSIPLIGLAEDNDDLVLKTEAQIQFQKDLIQQAFANDDVFREFEEEKSRIVEGEAPKDKDITLPGWGSWGGAGIDMSKVKRVIQKAKPGEGIQPSQRKDAQLKHVIINEQKIKSIAKYQVNRVPYPFENKLQYEASQRMPVGKEWNALAAHQKQIRPRVETMTGTVIAPLSYAKKHNTDAA